METRHAQYQRITINPDVCFGKPCIRGMRFPVTTLLSYLSSGMTVPELIRDFPFLEEEDIRQALGFSASMMDERYIPLNEARA